MWTDPRFIVTIVVLTIAGVYDFSITLFLLGGHLSQVQTDMIAVIVGSLNTNGLVTAISYWLGSSASSQEKNKTIKELSQGSNPQAEALKK